MIIMEQPLNKVTESGNVKANWYVHKTIMAIYRIPRFFCSIYISWLSMEPGFLLLF